MVSRPVLTEDLIRNVKELIKSRDQKGLREVINRLSPADLADLIEHIDKDERIFIFEILDPEDAGEVLKEVESPFQESILNELDNDAVSEIVQEMDSDDAADIVGDLPQERIREIIERVHKDVSDELKRLLPYPPDTAGGIMALEFVAVNQEATIQEAIQKIREKYKEVKNVYYLFVVDDEGRLVGVVSLKDLVVHSPETKVKEIMNPDVVSAVVDMDQEEVYHLVKKYDLVTIPVVDRNGKLLGRITHDDIIDVIEDETDEDISLMAGVMKQEITEQSPFKISRARLGWLILGLAGELIAATVIKQFESSLQRIIAISFFFPVIMAMGGSTGNQAAAVAVRGLATGDIGLVNMGRRVWLEIKVAVLNGVILGIILGMVVGMWLSDYKLGFVVALALIVVVLNAGFMGASLPLIFKKLNIDPALATVPFVATSNDILGLLIYLGMITVFLKYFA